MGDIQRQEWNENLEKSKFAKKMKIVLGAEKGVYEREEVKTTKLGLEILARFRMEMGRDESVQILERRKAKNMQNV